MVLLVVFSMLIATALFLLLYMFSQQNHQGHHQFIIMSHTDEVSTTQDDTNSCPEWSLVPIGGGEPSLSDSATPRFHNDSPPVTKAKDKWTMNDLNLVLNIAWEAKAKWYHIGLALGLTPGDLDAMKRTHLENVEDCFTMMMKAWLTSSKDTSCEKLANALQQPTVSHNALAASIQNKFYEADKKTNAECFPHLQLVTPTTMSPHEMTKLKCQLIDDAEKIQTKFSIFVLYIINSFNRRELAPHTLASHILQTEFCPQLNDNDVSKRIMKAKSVDHIMFELRWSRCISFFNYHLLEFVIQELGTIDEKEEFEKYLSSFKNYCKRCLFEVPQYLFDKPMYDGSSIQFALKVSSDFKKSMQGQLSEPSSAASDDLVVRISSRTLHLSVNDTINVLRKLAKVLDLHVGSFCLIDATPGCTKLVVSIPHFIAEDVLAKIDTNPGVSVLESSGIHIVSGPPGKPQAIEISSTDIKLSWTRPTFKRQKATTYAVYFRPATNPITVWERIQTDGPEEMITITNLARKGSSFIFKVCAIDNSTEGVESEESDEINVNINGAIIDKSTEGVELQSEESDKIKLTSINIKGALDDCYQEPMEVDKLHCTHYGDIVDTYHYLDPEKAFEVLVENGLNCNLRVLGCQLGLKPSHLDILEQSWSHHHLLFEILRKCYDRELLSWRNIVSALRKPALKEYRIANKICNTYKIMTGSSESDSIALLQSPRSGFLEGSLTFAHSISADAEPEISEVVNEIADVKDWEQLAISLGLTANDIDQIKQYDHREHRQRLAELWYERALDYSWGTLRRVLDKHCPRRVSDASVIPKIDDPQSVVESEIMVFERRFKELNIEARKELEKKYNTTCVEIVEDKLSSLPRSIAKEHHEYVSSIVKRKRPFTNLTVFFCHLNLYCWNFFEYHVLESLIESKCSEELREKMSKYVRDIEKFRQETTISDFIKSASHLVKRRTIPPRFKKAVVEHAIDPDTYTLAELDAFRKDTLGSLHLKLSECASQVYRIKYG